MKNVIQLAATAALSCTIIPLPAQTPAKAQPYELRLSPLTFQALVPSPPAVQSKIEDADLAEMHKIEQERTVGQVKRAQYDDTHEEIFLYADVLGSDFTPEHFPRTAALSARLRRTSGSVDNPLKQAFKRVRPYNYDRSLHPVCATNQEFSYPSGHAVNGYVYAYVLAELLPAYHDQLLTRADDYARNRVICGVHYTEDVEASRRVAAGIFGALFANEEFRADLEASRKELQSAGSVVKDVTQQANKR